MNYKIELCRSARYFSIPCKAVDGYLKEAPGDYFKVLLYILSSESDALSTDNIANAAGVSSDIADNAVLYWNKAKVISAKAQDVIIGAANELSRDTKTDVPVRYSAKEVAEIVKSDSDIRLLFDQLEATLGRELKFAERCGYINLVQYYGFSVGAIILLVEYCKKIGKTSVKYIETIAKSLYSNGLSDYRDVEKEIERMERSKSYESGIKSLLGISAKLSTKQTAIVENWRISEFSNELISHAYDICLDNTGKLSFPYINKILESWHEKGIKTPEQADALQKSRKKEKAEEEHSYSLEDFENYSVNFISNKQEG